MSIRHTARNGKTYYLHVMAGKNGKPKYHFSTRPDGTLAEAVPPDFEIYENIHGQVFLRRAMPRLITDEELDAVKAALRRHADEWRYEVEVKKNAMIIYEAADNLSTLENIAAPWVAKETVRQSAIQHATHTAMMRFVLVDREQRLFLAERFCFRGAVDDWIDIGGPPQRLPSVIRKFVKHLGGDSLFELY
ncbi:MAG: hypothetical protein HY298_09215 [Verrucomicrobia bacterium]|nr:hypothetical protein [Verrucomicrobiota bacterium]